MSTAVIKREPRAARPWFRRSPISTFRDEMQDFVTQVFGDELDWPNGRMTLNLNLSETDQAIEVRLDLPGIEAKDVDIQVSGNMLTVRGERKEHREEKGRIWHRVECRCGSFSRSILLPCPVKEDAAEAQFRDGVLTISLPKTAEAVAHRIKVKS